MYENIERHPSLFCSIIDAKYSFLIQLVRQTHTRVAPETNSVVNVLPMPSQVIQRLIVTVVSVKKGTPVRPVNPLTHHVPQHPVPHWTFKFKLVRLMQRLNGANRLIWVDEMTQNMCSIVKSVNRVVVPSTAHNVPAQFVIKNERAIYRLL